MKPRHQMLLFLAFAFSTAHADRIDLTTHRRNVAEVLKKSFPLSQRYFDVDSKTLIVRGDHEIQIAYPLDAKEHEALRDLLAGQTDASGFTLKTSGRVVVHSLEGQPLDLEDPEVISGQKPDLDQAYSGDEPLSRELPDYVRHPERSGTSLAAGATAMREIIEDLGITPAGAKLDFVGAEDLPQLGLTNAPPTGPEPGHRVIVPNIVPDRRGFVSLKRQPTASEFRKLVEKHLSGESLARAKAAIAAGRGHTADLSQVPRREIEDFMRALLETSPSLASLANLKTSDRLKLRFADVAAGTERLADRMIGDLDGSQAVDVIPPVRMGELMFRNPSRSSGEDTRRFIDQMIAVIIEARNALAALAPPIVLTSVRAEDLGLPNEALARRMILQISAKNLPRPSGRPGLLIVVDDGAVSVAKRAAYRRELVRQLAAGFPGAEQWISKDQFDLEFLIVDSGDCSTEIEN